MRLQGWAVVVAPLLGKSQLGLWCAHSSTCPVAGRCPGFGAEHQGPAWSAPLLEPDLSAGRVCPTLQSVPELGGAKVSSFMLTEPRWWEGCGGLVSAQPDLSSGTELAFFLPLTLACRSHSSLTLSSSPELLGVMDFLKLIMRGRRFTTRG